MKLMPNCLDKTRHQKRAIVWKLQIKNLVIPPTMRRDHPLDHLAGMPKLMTSKNTDLLCGLTACGGLIAAGAFSLALNLLMLTVPLYMMSVFDWVLTSRSEEIASLPQFPRFNAN